MGADAELDENPELLPLIPGNPSDERDGGSEVEVVRTSRGAVIVVLRKESEEDVRVTEFFVAGGFDVAVAEEVPEARVREEESAVVGTLCG